MTIPLVLSPEQEHRLTASAARQDAQTVREILLQAVEPTVEGLLRSSASQPRASSLTDVLDNIAAEFHEAPALSLEANSRGGIYADHP